jgi:hypothetical protein
LASALSIERSALSVDQFNEAGATAHARAAPKEAATRVTFFMIVSCLMIFILFDYQCSGAHARCQEVGAYYAFLSGGTL